MLIELNGQSPHIPESAFVAANAVLAGEVILGEGASVWYGASLRGDNEPITLGRNSNVQDNCTFHTDVGKPVTLGEGVSVGHNAVVHGATIEDFVLIGMGAVVLNGAVIGSESLVAAGAVVPQGAVIPSRSLVAGVPAKVRRELSDEEVAGLHRNAEAYERLSELHRNARVID